jgi:hypothetical protein
MSCASSPAPGNAWLIAGTTGIAAATAELAAAQGIEYLPLRPQG